MELEFGKHFKDATNLLLMMDHDSGYVEGSENYINHQQETDSFKSNGECNKVDNFLLSEDALLEKPVLFGSNHNHEQHAESEIYEETRNIFSLQDGVIDSSVKSQGSGTIYSGLESECGSENSAEIPLQDPITVELKDEPLDDSFAKKHASISASDMSIESSIYEPVIIERSTSISTEENISVLTHYEQTRTPPHTEVIDPNASEFVQPTCSTKVPSSVKKEKRKLTLVFSKVNKENEYRVKRKYPSITPEKPYQNPVNPDISPDIFGDEEVDIKNNYFQTQSIIPSVPTQVKGEEMYSDKLDHKLLKRTQKGMSGVLPPPSVTVVKLTYAEMLDKIHQNTAYFWNSEQVIETTQDDVKDVSLNSSSESSNMRKSLLVNVNSLEDVINSEFPNILNIRFHGLHHNRCKLSEEIESLCDKYQKRFVGGETQSSCTVFELSAGSPSKRKSTKPRWGAKSPGRRLSHLARRRITFSSANMQAGGSNLAGSRARQILVDARKMELLNRRKSPRKTPRKTPSKSPKVKTRTPSSSAKKNLAMRFRKLTGEFETLAPSSSEVQSTRKPFMSPGKLARSENKGGSMSTKRALFQSPDRDKKSSLSTGNPQNVMSSAEKSKLRRALFPSPKGSSPFKGRHSPFKQALRFGFDKKRKRSDSDDMHPSKFPRSMSMDTKMLTARNESGKSIGRTQSEMNVSRGAYDLTDAHKKKLQWAVYDALQSQKITREHPQWKVFASMLGKVTRHIFTCQMASSAAAGVRLEGGTTERMNRIAKHHILSVVKGKSFEEVIEEYKRSRPKVNKPQGYVPPEDHSSLKNKVNSGSKENVLQDRANTFESWERERVRQTAKPSTTETRIQRIKKVIDFSDDR
ncbi:cyclin E-interacting protein minus [Rhynchophorus ferrugineus]|uniref:cyclin E-interacting protein minus n=1 Tax=Rhynchophorus ferrugineus TaxID=354439 RepID=UPI003FCE7B06